MEDRFPIVDILQQTPPIPPICQWSIFLRNHDELTLEMVTDEERDYMYRVYARDRQARINLGIRRRLAPLLDNNRRKIELMNGLLFSLPGTPVIYYGDEIGMGDNIYLGDRNGVRTPMQWSPDRNAGFSDANPQQLYSPVIIDSEYSVRNGQRRNAAEESAVAAVVDEAADRAAATTPALGRGSLEFLAPENSKILAFIRELPRTAAYWWWPTCRGSCSLSSSTCRDLPASAHERCLGIRDFPQSAALPTCSHSLLMASTGSLLNKKSAVARGSAGRGRFLANANHTARGVDGCARAAQEEPRIDSAS